ncbi:HAMP domain-containing histidine kinase, partial [bacterium]|nr:HAMP domain-containing histidine kinase [bacterium]
AHELRNPLAAIKATVQVIGKEGLSREAAEAFRVICEEVGRADAAVKKLLGRSKRSPESGEVRLPKLIEDAVEAIQPRLDGLELTVNLIEGNCAVGCDADALVSALIVLLVNAVEAATTQISLTLTTQGNRAIIRVSDDGPPIAAADTKRLFEPFFTTKPGGTGLGLFLARQAIGTCNGSLSYDREAQTGSVFEIRLPLAREP